jgi:hypothetical protein
MFPSRLGTVDRGSDEKIREKNDDPVEGNGSVADPKMVPDREPQKPILQPFLPTADINSIPHHQDTSREESEVRPLVPEESRFERGGKVEEPHNSHEDREVRTDQGQKTIGSALAVM